MKKNKITMQENINELEEELYRLNKENEKILNQLKEAFKESDLKDTKLNEYLEKKIMEQKLEDNNNK